MRPARTSSNGCGFLPGWTERPLGSAPPRMPGESSLGGHAAALGENALAFYERCAQYAGLVEIRIWHKTAYVATDPALIDEVLRDKSEHFVKPLGLQVLRPAFGDGLLTAEHDVWTHNRRLIQPAFKSHKIGRYAEVAYALARDRFASFKDRTTVDIGHEMAKLCLSILTQTLFGDSEREGEELIFELTGAVQAFTLDYSRFGFPPFPRLLPTRSNVRFRRAVRAIDRWLLDLIARRRRVPNGDDLLGLMMNARDPSGTGLSDRQLRDEMVTMFLAGHETISSALAWTLQLLATHTSVQDKLVAELDARVAAAQPPTDRGSYLEAIVDEGLRLYPPVYRIGRLATRACSIGPFAIPRGANVLIPQWAVQRSARYFEVPNTFRPERWTDAMRSALPRCAFFPFGGGKRVCPGASLSAREEAMILAALFEQVRVEPAGPVAPEPFQGLTLAPPEGKLELRVLRRSPRECPPRPARDGEVAACPAATIHRATSEAAASARRRCPMGHDSAGARPRSHDAGVPS
jgi:cytochrome P450